MVCLFEGGEVSGAVNQRIPEVNSRHIREVPIQHLQESQTTTACDTFQNQLGTNCQLQDRGRAQKSNRLSHFSNPYQFINLD